jgi:hypothetical protein
MSSDGCTALELSPLGRGWVELYHSAPHWPDAVIIYRATPTGPPHVRRLLPDPSRAGFRVVRLRLLRAAPPAGLGGPGDSSSSGLASDAGDGAPAAQAELCFRLRPSGRSGGAPGDSIVYAVPAVAGRFVVTTGIPVPARVGAPDIAQCLRLYRPLDAHVELVFRPPTWWPGVQDDGSPACVCQVAYADHANPPHAVEWPRLVMERVAALEPASASAAISVAANGADAEEVNGVTDDMPRDRATQQPIEWFLRFKSNGLDCVFTDGGEAWDNNHGGHYVVPLPGRYLVENECMRYLGPSELDRHLYPL